MEETQRKLGPRVSLLERVLTLTFVLVPFVGLVMAIVQWWGVGFRWVDLWLMSGMYLATGLGVTVGYHRLFAHRSFDTIAPVKFVLGVLGSMSAEGPLFKWTAVHRWHHRYSDQKEDVHSPRHYGGGALGVMSGLWYAHIGWMFGSEHPNLAPIVRDLQADRLLQSVHRLFGAWVLLGMLLPAALGGFLTLSWSGVFFGFLWGGLVRMCLVHHVTWSVNSVCHLWGRRPYESKDESRNNFVVGVLALGEGWHNNHHAFPSSARHGLRWWQFDLSYLVIRAMEFCGLAWRVRLPAPVALRLKRSALPMDG